MNTTFWKERACVGRIYHPWEVVSISIQSFLLTAVTHVQEWLGIASVLFLLFAAVQLFTAGDNPMQRSQAWHRLLSVAAGLLVIIFARQLIGLLYSWAGVPAPF